MAAESIGRCKCPVCGSDKARLSLAKSRLSVLTCNGCNFQGFARSDRSDELLRARIVAEPVRTEPTEAPAPAPVRTAPAAAPNPTPVRTGNPPPPNPAPGFRWGMLG